MPSAQAASFDCAKASSFVEKAICSDKQLSSMDDQLARLYKAARATGGNAALDAEQFCPVHDSATKFAETKPPAAAATFNEGLRLNQTLGGILARNTWSGA
jgi:uncharacterized protein